MLELELGDEGEHHATSRAPIQGIDIGRHIGLDVRDCTNLL